MTCVVAVLDKKYLYMGGDSAFTAGWYDLDVFQAEKVFMRGEAMIGVAGSPRAANLLRYTFEFPPPSRDLMAYMATDFVNSVRECFKAGGYAAKENEVEGHTSNMLIGIRGRLFKYDFDYQVQEVKDYTAIGSGERVALGALFATRGKPALTRIKTALLAAEQFNAAVRGPFSVLKLRRKDA